MPGWRRRHPAAHRRRLRSALQQCGGALGQRHGSAPHVTGEDQRELVAADPGGDTALGPARDHREGVGGQDDHPVSGVVAGLVVDLLQPVQVEEHDGGAGLSLLEQPGQAVVEDAPVGQPGQRVLVGHPGHPLEQLAGGDRLAHECGDLAREGQVRLVVRRLLGRAGDPELAPQTTLAGHRHGDARTPCRHRTRMLRSGSGARGSSRLHQEAGALRAGRPPRGSAGRSRPPGSARRRAPARPRLTLVTRRPRSRSHSDSESASPPSAAPGLLAGHLQDIEEAAAALQRPHDVM